MTVRRLALRPYPAQSAFLGEYDQAFGEHQRARRRARHVEAGVIHGRQSVRSRCAEQASQSATSRRSSDRNLVAPAWLSAAAIYRCIIVAHGFARAAIRAANARNTAARRRSLGIASGTHRRYVANAPGLANAFTASGRASAVRSNCRNRPRFRRPPQ